MKRIGAFVLLVGLLLVCWCVPAFAAGYDSDSGQIVQITKQPEDVLATFWYETQVQLEAVGDGLRYQWYYADASSEDFAEVPNNDRNVYSFEMTRAMDGRRVYCVVTDQYGNSVRSDTVTLTGKTLLCISSWVVNTKAYDGELAVVDIDAHGDGLSYQWYYSTPGMDGFELSPDHDTNVFGITMSPERDGTQAYCVVTDRYGDSVRSEIATMYLNTIRIIQFPAPVQVCAGELAKVYVEAQGTGLTYQWFCAPAGSEDFQPAEGFTSDSYEVTMTEDVSGRLLRCQITDVDGKTAWTPAVAITMKTEVKITKQPTSVKVYSGEVAKVSVKAQGDGLTYNWYYANAGSTKYALTKSFTGDSYNLSMTEARNGRKVYCVITDQYGNSVRTKTVSLKIKTELKILTQPRSVRVAEGKTAKVGFKVQGDGLTYKWYYAKKGSTKYVATDSFTSTNYSVKMNASRNGRKVYCIITDAYGNSVKSKTVSLNMRTPLKITQQPVSVKVANGKTAKVTIDVQGDGVTYKWYYADGSTFKVTGTFTSNYYSVKMNDARDGRRVYCVITDKYGNSVKTNTVTLSMK